MDHEFIWVIVGFIFTGSLVIYKRRWITNTTVEGYVKAFWKYNPSEKYMKFLENSMVFLGVLTILAGILVLLIAMKIVYI
jgi:hypothetical protein